ncbi:MAG: hypothetical protein OXC10_02320 [Rhodospirillaceae bacterium]|nr:hypothetical protein [Rhodospirillaceae bacterium]
MSTPFAAVALLALVPMLMVGACTNRGDPVSEADDGPIKFERNSEFSGPRLRVFLNLPDGTPVSVNIEDDAVSTRPGRTVIPGHQARDWTFVKDAGIGTSVVYALVSWDPEDPADYLMAGWWAQFPDQHLPGLSFAGSQQFAIVDGPEMDPAIPPDLPLAGQATYVGQAGGLYSYALGSNWGDAAGSYIVEEWEGHIALTADFAAKTIAGCVGCEGDLVTRRAHFGVFLGDEVRDAQAIATGYEMHLGEAPIGPDGTISHPVVSIRHPERDVTASEGNWGGSVSSIPDGDGNPRLAAGFVRGAFQEGDGSAGLISGVFVAPSERLGRAARQQ